jgi:hypothetical protein
MQMKLLGITNVDFNITDQQLIKFSICSKYWRKNMSITVKTGGGHLYIMKLHEMWSKSKGIDFWFFQYWKKIQFVRHERKYNLQASFMPSMLVFRVVQH